MALHDAPFMVFFRSFQTFAMPLLEKM